MNREPVRSGRRRLIWWVVSGLLGASLLALALRGVDWKRVWIAIGTAQWEYLIAASGISCGSYFLRSLRWRILLNAEASLDVWTVFCANMAGYVGNNFLPGRAGELVRTFVISRESRLSKTYVLTTALCERLMDVIALVLWSSVILVRMTSKPRWIDDISRTTGIVAAAGAVAIAVLPHTGNLVTMILRRMPLPEHVREWLLKISGQIMLGVRAFHSWRRFLGFAVATVAIWLMDACGVMIGVQAFHFHVSLSVALLLLTGMGLGSALPATPGYVGIYQFVAVTVLTPFGVSRDSALAFMLVGQAMGYVVVLLLGLPGLRRIQRMGFSFRRPPSGLKTD